MIAVLVQRLGKIPAVIPVQDRTVNRLTGRLHEIIPEPHMLLCVIHLPVIAVFIFAVQVLIQVLLVFIIQIQQLPLDLDLPKLQIGDLPALCIRRHPVFQLFMLLFQSFYHFLRQHPFPFPDLFPQLHGLPDHALPVDLFKICPADQPPRLRDGNILLVCKFPIQLFNFLLDLLCRLRIQRLLVLLQKLLRVIDIPCLVLQDALIPVSFLLPFPHGLPPVIPLPSVSAPHRQPPAGSAAAPPVHHRRSSPAASPAASHGIRSLPLDAHC